MVRFSFTAARLFLTGVLGLSMKQTPTKSFPLELTEQENSLLIQELADKDKQIAQLEVSKKELEVKFTNLKMARTISLYDKDIKDAKQRLTSLVREVDKCIALLNE